MTSVLKDSDNGTQALRDWYNAGADGAISWGEHGDFAACVAIASQYVDSPEAYCNERHQDAVGGPPGSEDDGSKSVYNDVASVVALRLRAELEELSNANKRLDRATQLVKE